MEPFCAHTTRDVVTVAGSEARGYLQGQLSADIAELPTGSVTRAFLLSPKGKVEAWARVRVDDEEVALDVDPGAGETLAARLERFRLRTPVTITLAAGVPTLAVRGTDLPDGLACGWPGVTGADLVGDPDDAPRAVTIPAGLTEDDTALEPTRIRAGVPRWGAEIATDVSTIPATLGAWVIEASVSFTKGCFTGQELVARIDSRGGNVPRSLGVVELDGPAPEAGAAVRGADTAEDAKPLGQVTSVAPEGSGSVALGFIGRGAEVPADVVVDGTPGRLLGPVTATPGVAPVPPGS